MIEIVNLSYAHRGQPILERTSFKLPNGRVYGIFGAKGSGKSTLLALLSGAAPLQSGSVRINGFDVEKAPLKARRCIGYFPQSAEFYKDVTVFEFLSFVASVKNVREDRKFIHVHEIMELLDLTEIRDRLLSKLALLDLRLVGLAQALVGNPEILILDDPTEDLSVSEAAEICEAVRSLAKNGKTVFFASSVASEILSLCDETMLMESGRLSPSTPTKELLEDADPIPYHSLTLQALRRASKRPLLSLNEADRDPQAEREDAE